MLLALKMCGDVRGLVSYRRMLGGMNIHENQLLNANSRVPRLSHIIFFAHRYLTVTYHLDLPGFSSLADFWQVSIQGQRSCSGDAESSGVSPSVTHSDAHGTDFIAWVVAALLACSCCNCFLHLLFLLSRFNPIIGEQCLPERRNSSCNA